jgi:Transglycosylase SLT domain
LSVKPLSRKEFVDRQTPRVFAAAIALAVCLAAPEKLLAAPVRIPLHINYALLTEALRQRLYTHGGRAQLWNGNNDCEYLYTDNPSFDRQNGIVQIDTGGYLNLGVPVDDHCLSPITWSGLIEADTVPYIAEFALKLHVTDVNLYDRYHRKSLLVGRGFDLIKSNVVPALEGYSFDLMPAIHELEGLAQMAVAPADEAPLHLALATMRLEPVVIAGQTGLQLTLAIDLPPQAPTTPISASAAPLRPEEIAAWNNALDNWDAFLVFVVRQTGTTVSDPKVRNELLDILLESRQRLVAALGQPQRISGPDPVRLLFLEEWTRLGQVIENAAGQGRLGNRSLEFLSFISAGDALFALDQASSALGIRISADDLRRLARIMAPQTKGDPLAYSFEEDPQLRGMFGLSAPLELPGPLELPEASAPGATPDGSGELLPDEAGHTSSTAPTGGASPGEVPTNPNNRYAPRSSMPSPAAGPLSMLPWGLRTLAPRAAQGAEIVPETQVGTGQILTLGRKLHAVVVSEGNALTYSHDMGQLLDLAAQYQLQDNADDPSLRRSWPILLKAAAWQESCWRQYVTKHRQVWYLESKTGDIGLMQINKYVWRGFYSMPRLRWDVVYNVSAGSEILQRFQASSSRHLHSNNPDILARAAYAAYNGGPDAYYRWRQPDEPRALREIDQAFWLKYRATEAGQPFDILSCAAQWDRLRAD